MSIATRHVAPGGFVGSTRKPSEIRGFMVHLAEGNNVAAYLSRNPARGVSVNYVVEADGEIVSMVPELRVAGSINPKTVRRTDDPNGYYGASHAKAVLGSLWLNPNRGVIAIEVAGKAVNGPNAKQVTALVRLFNDCRRRSPGIKPLGHRDFQSVKRCPGATKAMRAAFAAMGGHGADYRKVRLKPKPPVVHDPVTPVTPCDARLVQAQVRIAELEDQVEAMAAAIAAAIGTLDDFVEDVE